MCSGEKNLLWYVRTCASAEMCMNTVFMTCGIRSREHTNAGSAVSAYIVGIIIASLYTHPRTCFNKR